MKSRIKNMLPEFVLDRVRILRETLESKRNSRLSCEEVFTEIYETNLWGGVQGEFCSGAGTAHASAVEPYISKLRDQASGLGFAEKTLVDLGCGDFEVGKQLRSLFSKYIGTDVVKPLVVRNQNQFGNSDTEFIHLDIVADELPIGDVCTVRQVFQHLSNQQIKSVLIKLKQYQRVYITEHYPSDNNSITPNKDKVHGADIRVYRNSGVYLSHPPFNVPEDSLELVLEVEGVGLRKGVDQGVIRTYLYRP